MKRGLDRCKLAIFFALLLTSAAIAAPTEVGSTTLNPSETILPARERDPLDQGGERCIDATVIPNLPYCDFGTKVGHVNDYTPPCATGTAAPDVVYVFTPPATMSISASLCFSAYNTVIHIWRGCPTSGGVLLCCNDNLCGLQSCCQDVIVTTGAQIFIIVDGSTLGGGANAGNYQLQVVAGPQCPTQQCPPDTCPYPDRDFEPLNNACAGANLPSVICGDSLCGEIATSNDVDWYILDLPTGSCWRTTLDVLADDTPGYFPFGGGLNSRLALFSFDCGTQIALDDDGGIGTDSKITLPCIEAGRYKVRVDNSSPTLPGGPYILAAACTPCTCPADTCPYVSLDIEPVNNICIEAIPDMTCGDTLCGVVEANTAGDYYRLRVPGPGCQLVKLDVFGDDTPGMWPFGQGLDPAVAVYNDVCNTVLGVDDDGGVGSDAHLELCLPQGLYRVFVRRGATGAEGPYILAAYCEPCECPGDTCPYVSRDVEPINNNCGTQNPFVFCGDTVCGEIQPVGDQDWYLLQVQMTPCARITIDIFGHDTPGWWPFGQGLNPRVWLYGPDCATFVAMDDDGGVGTDSRLVSPCVSPGFYMIRVEGVGAAAPSTGPYIMAIHCDPCPCPDTCDVVCPANTPPEGEPCPNIPDNFNSGCDHAVGAAPSVTVVECNQDICGSSFNNGNVRDNDWFLVRTDEPDTIWLCVTAEFEFVVLMLDPGPGTNPCLEMDTLDCDRAAACSTACVGACVPPGQYLFKIAPFGPTVFPCATYLAQWRCTICSPDVCVEPDSVVIMHPDSTLPEISLYWPPVPGATDYRIYRSDAYDVLPVPVNYVATTTDTFFVDTGILPSPSYKHMYTIVSHCKRTNCGN